MPYGLVIFALMVMKVGRIQNEQYRRSASGYRRYFRYDGNEEHTSSPQVMLHKPLSVLIQLNGIHHVLNY